MLHFSYAFIVCSFLLQFVLLVALTEGGMSMTQRERAEHPYICHTRYTRPPFSSRPGIEASEQLAPSDIKVKTRPGSVLAKYAVGVAKTTMESNCIQPMNHLLTV